jgi:hypothetical protein
MLALLFEPEIELEIGEGLQIKPNTTYWKWKESAHMSPVNHLISEPNLDISPIWAIIITAVVNNLTSVWPRHRWSG